MRASTFALAVLLVACDREKSQPKIEAKPLPAAPVASSSASATASAGATGAPAHKATPAPEIEAWAFDAEIGTGTSIRLYLERQGKELRGVFVGEGGEGERHVRGEMVEERRVRFDEIDDAGKPRATFDGKFWDGVLKGTWKDLDTGKTRIVVTKPPAFAGDAFTETYAGSIGTLRVRARLKVEGGKVTGVYRYARSKSDLALEGTVDPRGEVLLRETAGAKQTGKIGGFLLSRGFLAGRWSSPDGKRSLPLVLRASPSYPEQVVLEDGTKVVPQEEYASPAKHCELSSSFPAVVAKNETAKLDAALKSTALLGVELTKSDCAGASAELPYDVEAAYSIVKAKPPLFGVAFSHWAFTGGAHGSGWIDCRVGDVEHDVLIDLATKLTPEGKQKLEDLVNERLKKAHGAESLEEIGFFEDRVSLDKADLCLSAGGLEVSFDPYKVAPYVMGSPSVALTKTEVKPFFVDDETLNRLWE